MTQTPPHSAAGGRQKRGWTTGRVLKTAAITVVAGLLVLELGFRFVLGMGSPMVVQADPAALYVLKPNQQHYRFFAHTHINEWSMRSPSFAMPKPAGVYRVLLIGDSMTYGTAHVDQSAIFATLLNQELPGLLGRRVEVLNASAGAWAIGNELGYLKSRGTFDADLVVLVLNTGDTYERPAQMSDVGGDIGPKTYFLGCALCEFNDRFVIPTLMRLKPKQDLGTENPKDLEVVAAANWAQNDQRLSEFQRLVKADGSRMGMIFLAMRGYMPPGTTDGVPKPIEGWVHEHNVPLVDVTPAEMQHTAKEMTQDSIHMTSFGNRVTATYLEQHWNELDPALRMRVAK